MSRANGSSVTKMRKKNLTDDYIIEVLKFFHWYTPKTPDGFIFDGSIIYRFIAGRQHFCADYVCVSCRGVLKSDEHGRVYGCVKRPTGKGLYCFDCVRKNEQLLRLFLKYEQFKVKKGQIRNELNGSHGWDHPEPAPCRD